MIYRSYADLGHDLQLWAARLPRFAAIAGVPRSGVIIASMLATYQNCHLISLNDLLWGVEQWKEPLRRNCPGADGPILVVDDTVATGNKIMEIRKQIQQIPYRVVTGAYLVTDQGKKFVEYSYECCGNTDHLFQFNIFHHWFNERTLTDLDGVLCEDWCHDHEDHDLADLYSNHLANGRCLIKPTFPLQAIVTGRLECHRAATEAWLAKHGIRYGQLIMFPAASVHDRHHVAEWKGAVYRASQAMMFVESDSSQSRTIKNVSGRDVLDWSQQKMI